MTSCYYLFNNVMIGDNSIRRSQQWNEMRDPRQSKDSRDNVNMKCNLAAAVANPLAGRCC